MTNETPTSTSNVRYYTMKMSVTMYDALSKEAHDQSRTLSKYVSIAELVRVAIHTTYPKTRPEDWPK